MSNAGEGASMMGLGYVPVEPQWLLGSRAFHHADARVVRAAFLMLQAAWQSKPAGSIASSFRSLAQAGELSEAEVEDNYEVLTEGWELRGGRLCHLGMTALCERIASRYGHVLEKIATQSALLVQGLSSSELTDETAPVQPLKSGQVPLHTRPQARRFGVSGGVGHTPADSASHKARGRRE